MHTSILTALPLALLARLSFSSPLQKRADPAFQIFGIDSKCQGTPQSTAPVTSQQYCINLPGGENLGKFVFPDSNWQAGFYDAPECPADKRHYQGPDDYQWSVTYAEPGAKDSCMGAIWSDPDDNSEGSVWISPNTVEAPGGWPTETLSEAPTGTPGHG